MIQRAAPPPRGPRIGRGKDKGGIQKRKTGPTRLDKDGDLVMSASTSVQETRSGKGGIGNQKPNVSHGVGREGQPAGLSRGGSIASQRQQQAIIRALNSKHANVIESRITNGELASLRVRGLQMSKAASNSDGGLEALLGFLERKASGLDAKSNRSVRIKKSRKEGEDVIITASVSDIALIKRLNGWTFALSQLKIETWDSSDLVHTGKDQGTSGLSAEARDLQDKIRRVLSTRYNVDLKLLDLSALGQDQNLRQLGLFDDAKSVSKLFPALMATCDKLFTTRQAKRDAIVSVTLAKNDLVDIHSVITLAQTFPDLKNLDLSTNKFQNLQVLEGWRWKFRQLENLIISGNPLETATPAYVTELLKWYPKLLYLNGATVRTPQDIVAATLASTPIALNPPSFRDVSQVGEKFVLQFFGLYDRDRAGLVAQFYDAKSTFSLSINTSIRSNHDASMPIAPWTSYIKHSRNLTKITHLNTRMNRCHRGNTAIQRIWTELPSTRHPDITTRSDKYIVECHPLPGLADPNGQSSGGVDGLLVSLHGEFEEVPQPIASSNQVMRSFSRNFVIGPGPSGGPLIRVVSDMLVLRAWAPLQTPWLNVNVSSLPQQQQVVGGDMGKARTPEEFMIMQLVEKTGMNPQYAELCLKESGADMEKAVIIFQQNKANLPPDAFMNGAVSI